MESVLNTFLTSAENPHVLLYVGLLLILSYLGGHIANRFKAPRMIGYLVMGMLLSPSVSGVLPETMVKEDLGLITHFALAVIAFSIGGSLDLTKLGRLGKQISWIAVTQAIGAFILTTLVLCLFFLAFFCQGEVSPCFRDSYFPMALVIGSIAAATAPAAILAIVLEYRARGPMTTTLLGVVALDDAITIFLYAFAISIAQSFLTYDALTIHKFVLEPFIPVVVSLLIGGAVGVGIRYLCRLVSTRQAMLGVMLGAIFITAGLGLSLKTHALLANMMSGFVAVNIVKHHEDIFEVVESIEEPMFGMFFALAGAHLNFKLLETAGLLAVVITVGRFAGKLAGSWVGSRISGAPTEVKRYLGFALLPTAGVTVGLVLDAQIQLGSVHFSGMMLSGVLGSVIINELITPFLVRFSLFRAGEAASKAEKK